MKNDKLFGQAVNELYIGITNRSKQLPRPWGNKISETFNAVKAEVLEHFRSESSRYAAFFYGTIEEFNKYIISSSGHESERDPRAYEFTRTMVEMIDLMGTILESKDVFHTIWHKILKKIVIFLVSLC